MKYFSTFSAALFILVLPAFAGAQTKNSPISKELRANISSAQASNSSIFIENKGQWDKSVLFAGHSGNMDVRLTTSGPVLTVVEPRAKGKWLTQELRMEVAGSKSFSPENPTQTRVNFLGSRDQSKWGRNAREYHEVRSDLGKGLSLRYYFDQGRPRYDLIVQPGANPSGFAFRIKGASKLSLSKSGTLNIGTKAGTIEEKGLFAYQEENGSRKPVTCSMSLRGNTVRFRTGAYDHSKTLVIDPLLYSTWTGDWFYTLSGTALPYSIVRDSQGNIWIYGTVDAPPVSYIYPNPTPYIQKISPDGKSTIATTYVFNNQNGGWSQSTYQINALTVDHTDDPVIVGEGYDVPTTTNGYQQTTYKHNAFVQKFSPDGSNVLYSSALGGTTSDLSSDTIDRAFAVAIDSNNNAVIVGSTISNDFPVTANAFQKTRTPNCQDGFVTVLSLFQPQLIYSSYFGGAGDANANPTGGLTSADAVAINSQGNVVIGGFTASKTLPTSVSAYQNANRGADNAFVATFNPATGALQASTYLGGSNVDLANGIGLTSDDGVVITGSTTSPDFPATSGAF